MKWWKTKPKKDRVPSSQELEQREEERRELASIHRRLEYEIELIKQLRKENRD